MTRDTIKYEALGLFVAQGYDGTSMSDIAGRVKIRPSSIYAHFKSKDELFLAIFADVIAEKLADLEEIKRQAKGGGIEALLHSILMSRVREIETNKNNALFYKRNALFPPAHLKTEIQRSLFAYEDQFTRFLIPSFVEGIEQGEVINERVEKLVVAFYCVLDGLYVLSHYHHLDSYRKVVDDAWSLFWQSIKA